ncbi:DUF3558 domain-containing protein [Halopolyspora algeriensis]|nr:DUF3558 domain-containing protein [Halopolyspora algeriensis]
MRHSSAATVLATAALVLSACGDSAGNTEIPGQAAPKPTQSEPDQSTDRPLADVKPCEVFTPHQAKQLGLNGPGAISEFDDSTCKWDIGDHLINVSVYKDMALDEINFSGDEKTSITFQGHKALLVRPNKDQCSLAFATSDATSVSVNSTVDVSAPAGKACKLVKKAAPMVETTIFGN